MTNLMKLLGKIPRSNKKWAGAESAEVASQYAGERGVSIRNTPKSLKAIMDLLGKLGGQEEAGLRPFTLGNSIFIPEGYADQKTWEKDEEGNYRQLTKEEMYEDIVYKEMPHVAQYRNRGLAGFGIKHLIDLISHGGGEKTYTIPGTTEHDAHNNPEKMAELMASLKPVGKYKAGK